MTEAAALLRARLARALADRERVAAFDHRVWSIRDKRLAAAARHPHWEALRRAAQAIKAHALDYLDSYLEQFAARAEAAGAVVHFAATGAAANRIVLELCRAERASLVAKSKSMTTEECGLNEFLEAGGLEVVDTDLGERIVQLFREAPSHIVAPAIHRSRGEIAALFARCFGPGQEVRADSFGALVEAARRAMRPQFLAAEVGITGANFAVAETGGIVVVENEGNSLLTTSVPSLHIAVVGIEKIVPRLADLGVFLALLARSATGQRITSYTTHYAGPQRREDAERGIRERRLHIVLLDNGRSRVLGERHHRRALACIRCGACLNVCPVYRRSLGHAYGWVYPGPIGSVLAPAMRGAAGSALAQASTLCGACTEACPVGIDLHEQLIARRTESRAARTPLAVRLAAALARRPRLARFLLKRLRRRPALNRRLFRAWLAPAAGVPTRLIPALPRESFAEWWQRRTRRNGR